MSGTLENLLIVIMKLGVNGIKSNVELDIFVVSETINVGYK
jgi:hypothetical protein